MRAAEFQREWMFIPQVGSCKSDHGFQPGKDTAKAEGKANTKRLVVKRFSMRRPYLPGWLF